MIRLTRYQKLGIALQRGVIVRSGEMKKYTANVTHLGVHPNGRKLAIASIEAESEMDAAKQAAAQAAREAFGPNGTTSFINARGPGLFLASVGLYHRHAMGGVTAGSSVSIKVKPL